MELHHPRCLAWRASDGELGGNSRFGVWPRHARGGCSRLGSLRMRRAVFGHGLRADDGDCDQVAAGDGRRAREFIRWRTWSLMASEVDPEGGRPMDVAAGRQCLAWRGIQPARGPAWRCFLPYIRGLGKVARGEGGEGAAAPRAERSWIARTAAALAGPRHMGASSSSQRARVA